MDKARLKEIMKNFNKYAAYGTFPLHPIQFYEILEFIKELSDKVDNLESKE